MNTSEVITKYDSLNKFPKRVEYLLNENRARAIRDIRKMLPVHFAHRNDRGPQGQVARSITRNQIADLRLLLAA